MVCAIIFAGNKIDESWIVCDNIGGKLHLPMRPKFPGDDTKNRPYLLPLSNLLIERGMDGYFGVSDELAARAANIRETKITVTVDEITYHVVFVELDRNKREFNNHKLFRLVNNNAEDKLAAIDSTTLTILKNEGVQTRLKNIPKTKNMITRYYQFSAKGEPRYKIWMSLGKEVEGKHDCLFDAVGTQGFLDKNMRARSGVGYGKARGEVLNIFSRLPDDEKRKYLLKILEEDSDLANKMMSVDVPGLTGTDKLAKTKELLSKADYCKQGTFTNSAEAKFCVELTKSMSAAISGHIFDKEGFYMDSPTMRKLIVDMYDIRLCIVDQNDMVTIVSTENPHIEDFPVFVRKRADGCYEALLADSFKCYDFSSASSVPCLEVA